MTGPNPRRWRSRKEGLTRRTSVEQGRYGPIFPKTPACYGFSIIAKIIPGREERLLRICQEHREGGGRSSRTCLAVLKLHYLRWVLFPIKGETYFMYQGIFDTDFDKYTEDAVAIFAATGINTVFENLEGFPKDWKTNPPAFVKFVREHQCPSFLEYGEYPYVSADEIKKALKLKAAFSKCSTRCNDSASATAHADTVRRSEDGTTEMNTTDPMAAVRQYIDAFNKGDAKGWRRCSLSQARFLTAWHRTCGRGQRPLRIGTETC